jgi:hypothetical protein
VRLTMVFRGAGSASEVARRGAARVRENLFLGDQH